MSDPMSRRTFVKAVAASAVVSSIAKIGAAEERAATAGTPTEWSYASGKQYDDPFNQVDVDAIVTLPSGGEERVPGFWAGGSTWRVRYAPPAPGSYKIRSVCSDAKNRDLHDQTMTLHVDAVRRREYSLQARPAENRRRRPALRARRRHALLLAGRHLVDGIVQAAELARRIRDAHRRSRAQGLHHGADRGRPLSRHAVVDERGANEAGFPWERDFARINPAYFDMADVRIQHLADHGLAACIVGFWGYFIPLHGHGQGEETLALPGRALERVSGGVVPGRRRHHALLPFQDQGAGCGDSEARTDRTGALRALHRSRIIIPSPFILPAPRGSAWTIHRCWISICCRPATATAKACPTPSRP